MTGGADPFNPDSDGTDPYGTGALRSAVLAAWRASPARFREDANAEEDLVLGSYRDRLVVELAQNAADAAVRAGVPGRLRLTLRQGGDGAVLIAANTGSPLDRVGRRIAVDAAGLDEAGRRLGRALRGRLRGGAGRVGRADVCCPSSGGVRWSAADTRALVAAEPC